MGEKYSHLSLSERRLIDYMRHYEDLSIREMARRLNRNHSTISREISREISRNSGCWCEQYYHNPAHWMAYKRLKERIVRDTQLNIDHPRY